MLSVVPRAVEGPVTETSFIDSNEAPPPTYEAATGYTAVPQSKCLNLKKKKKEKYNPGKRKKTNFLSLGANIM